VTAGFQASASIQGRRYEDIVEAILVASGWTIDARHEKVDGVEIDITATDQLGTQWWIECKGSWNGNRPGSRRSDTVKKAVCDAWLLSLVDGNRPYMLVTSHLPDESSHVHSILATARREGLITRIESTGAFVAFEVEEDDE
jgi:predicted RecB family endonuclease